MPRTDMKPFRCLTCDAEVEHVGDSCERCIKAAREDRLRSEEIERRASELAAYDRRTRWWWYDDDGRHIGIRGHR